MRFLRVILLIFTSLALNACYDCGCEDIDVTINSKSQSSQANLVLFADGCASTSGQLTNGIPNGSCDSTGQYVNRGKWVQVPQIVPDFNTRLEITTEGSMYFCSTGYDNQNPSPTMTISPTNTIKYSFDDGSKLPVIGGEAVAIVMAAGDTTGFTSSNGSASVVNNCQDITSSFPSYTKSLTSLCMPDLLPHRTGDLETDCAYYVPRVPYFSLLKGYCRAYNGFGLTIYVGDQQIVTLDQSNMLNDPNGYITPASRTFNMFNMIASNDLSSFYQDVNTKYGKDISGAGSGKFVFMVPDGVKGNLGFVLAEGLANGGTGHYQVQVNSTPTACYVENAEAGSTPDNRGAIELVVSTINPNDYDNAITAMNSATGSWATSDYYDQIIAYINSFAGITTSGSVSALNSLLVDSAESSLSALGLKPLLITSPDYVLDTINYYGGNLWMKVRDDYYSDNVGRYNVTVKYSFESSGPVSTFLDQLITPIVNTFWNLSHQMYQNFGSAHFLNIARMSLMIFIMVYGAQFALGLTRISAYDLLFRIIKIGVVVELFHVADSWNFFNAYFFQFFHSGMNSLISYVTGDYTDNKSGIFGFVDEIFTIFFAKQTWIKLTAFIPYLVGIFFIIAIVRIMALYILVLSRAIVSYLLVVIGIALLISLAPIFFILLLFKKTKSYFDNWIARLVDYALQPILMFGALSILTSFFLLFWNSLMDFNVCWGQIVGFKLNILPKFTAGVVPAVNLGCLVFYNIKGGLDTNYLNLVAGVLVLATFTQAINNLMSHIPEITSAITGVGSALEISRAANQTVQQGMDAVGKGFDSIKNISKKGGNFFSNLMRMGKRKGINELDKPGGEAGKSPENAIKELANSVSDGKGGIDKMKAFKQGKNLFNKLRGKKPDEKKRNTLPSVSGINTGRDEETLEEKAQKNKEETSPKTVTDNSSGNETKNEKK